MLYIFYFFFCVGLTLEIKADLVQIDLELMVMDKSKYNLVMNKINTAQPPKIYCCCSNILNIEIIELLIKFNENNMK